MSEQISILVVDDDDVLRNRLEKSFLRRGFIVYMAGDFDQAIGLAKLHGPSRAVLDLKMPGKSGLELLKAIRETSPKTCLLYTSPSPRDKRQSRMPSSA